MKCLFCDRTFQEEEAEKSCSSCSLFGGCGKIKCPHCGYEVPIEPKWIKSVRRIFGRTT